MRLSPNGRLWMGPNTLEVSQELYTLNRHRLVKKLSKMDLDKSIIVLQGGTTLNKYDVEKEYVFEQEANFLWCFGVVEPDFYGTIEIPSGRSTLFMPKLDPMYGVWSGFVFSAEHFKKKYHVDEVLYFSELEQFLKSKSPPFVVTLCGSHESTTKATLEANFPGIQDFTLDRVTLYHVIIELRTFKTEYELEVMRYVSKITSEAHKSVMAMSKPGTYEYQSEAQFLFYIYSFGGCRHAAYTSSCASGRRSAIIHYGDASSPSDGQIKDGDMCCYDMGGQYFGYASDITCSFPANGKFTHDQKMVYNVVLKACMETEAACKPGVMWYDVYCLGLRTILEGLKAGGILKGTVDDMMDAGIGRIFQPHGLGHLIGLDVHDVGDALPCYRTLKRTIRFERPLEKGMVFTIEPGCYFIDQLLDEVLADPEKVDFFDTHVLKRFRHMGGIRIESVYVLTDKGLENISPDLPRTVEEIETFMDNARQ
ncbi:putative manganese ion binding protein [Trypoxylus dichotomus]